MDLDQVLDSIEDAIDQGDLENALRLARRAERDFPAEPDVQLVLGDALWDSGDLRGARESYRKASQLEPESAEILASLAWSHFALAEFDDAQKVARQSNALLENADACAILVRLAERDGKLPEADHLARRAYALDPDEYPLPFRVSEEEFRQVVSEALDELPEEFRKALEGQVAVIVELVPPRDVITREEPPLDPELLGLYVGVPLPERESATAPPRLPDIIYLFHRNLEHEAGDRQELLEQIAITVYHEVGHYFGFDDDELEELDFG